MRDGEECVSFKDVRCERESDKAILVSIPDYEQPMWIPRSQIHEDSEVYGEGHTGTLVISEWIAKQKDLI